MPSLLIESTDSMIGSVGQREYERTSIIERLKLEPISDHDQKFRKHTVQDSYSLKHVIDFQMKVPFKRGHAYYEFIHDIENIYLKRRN